MTGNGLKTTVWLPLPNRVVGAADDYLFTI